jgi:hypothetical protein
MAVEITDATELQAMDADVTDDYIIMNDIDASGTATWNSGAGFLPIVGFTGTLDGQFYEISGLTIDRTTNDNGLFGTCGGCLIQRVRLIDVDIKGRESTGGITGGMLGSVAADGVITKCFVSGSIYGTERRVAGIAGRLFGTSGINGGTISQCVSEADLTQANGKTQTGGITGFTRFAAIYDCCNRGSTAVSHSTNDHGGIIGSADRAVDHRRCYSSATVTNSGSGTPGGLWGVATSPASAGDMIDSFWDTTVGPATSAAGTGKATAAMQDIDTYTDTATAGLDNAWDMIAIGDYDDEVWAIDDGNDYPILGYEVVATPPTPTFKPYWRQTPQLSTAGVIG